MADSRSGDSAAVRTRGLSRSYGDLVAVRDLDLEIDRGEMFTLVGPDGAGKTTVLRMLCGALEPTSGRAAVLGFDLEREISRVKSRIGYLSQSFSLYGDLTVDENIEFFSEIHGVRRSGDFGKRREDLLRTTRLGPFRGRLAERLSGGMKQKLALACTLIHSPEILFLDEPTTGVDPVSRRDFWMILSDLLGRGLTLVMTTPYLDEAERSTRVGLLSRGRLMDTGTPEELKSRVTEELFEIVCDDVRRAFFVLQDSGIPGLESVQVLGDHIKITVRPGSGASDRVRDLLESSGLPVRSWHDSEPSLENVFLSLTQNKEET